MRLFKYILIPAVLFLLPGYTSAGWVQQQSWTTAGLRSVYFINAQTGWVAGDTNFILRTTDGGAHWDRHYVDSLKWGAGVIRFWDSNLGLVGEGQYLNKSTDSGLTWCYKPGAGLGVPYGNIVFATPLKGWVIGGMYYSGDGGCGALYQTSDGGETWVKRDSSGSYVFRDVAFADSLLGCFTADNHGWTYPSDGFVKQTTDGGITWQTVATGRAFGPFRFLNRDFAWRTWYYHWPYSPESWHWGLEKTTDQGVHWIPIYNDTTYVGCSCGWNPRLALSDSLNGRFLLKDTLHATRDGGSTWSWQVPGRYLNDLFFTDSLNGWIVGYNGLILHTTDGGSGVWEEPAPSRLAPYASRLLVSPNPFTSFARVPGHSSEIFALYDVSGRRVGVYRGDRIGEGLQAGVYFLRAESGKAKPVRIVKVR
jgi:photosystem II stability/assembly factor-like uncharacterized protein